MDNKSNKDSIKEILEGHKKKFNVVAIVIGIAVVLVIGFGAAYVIRTLNSTPKSYTEENLNKYMENTKEQAQNNNTSNAEETGQMQQNSVEESQTTSTNGVGNNDNQTKTYAVSSSDNNTQSVTQSNVNQASSPKSQNVETSGPQIINPYTEKNKKKNSVVSKRKTKKHKAISKKIAVKHSLKKHRYVKKKQYVLQVSSNLNKRFVSATLERLKKCGYKAYIRIKIINDKVYRRVMVGPIRGYTAAKDEALLIKRQLKLQYTPIIKRYDKIP